jgi:hypothetical protein
MVDNESNLKMTKSLKIEKGKIQVHEANSFRWCQVPHNNIIPMVLRDNIIIWYVLLSNLYKENGTKYIIILLDFLSFHSYFL